MNNNDTEAAKSRIKNQTSGLSVSLIGRHYYFSPKLTAIIYFQHQYKKIATGRSIINRKVIIWVSF